MNAEVDPRSAEPIPAAELLKFALKREVLHGYAFVGFKGVEDGSCLAALQEAQASGNWGAPLICAGAQETHGEGRRRQLMGSRLPSHKIRYQFIAHIVENDHASAETGNQTG